VGFTNTISLKFLNKFILNFYSNSFFLINQEKHGLSQHKNVNFIKQINNMWHIVCHLGITLTSLKK